MYPASVEIRLRQDEFAWGAVAVVAEPAGASGGITSRVQVNARVVKTRHNSAGVTFGKSRASALSMVPQWCTNQSEKRRTMVGGMGELQPNVSRTGRVTSSRVGSGGGPQEGATRPRPRAAEAVGSMFAARRR